MVSILPAELADAIREHQQTDPVKGRHDRTTGCDYTCADDILRCLYSTRRMSAGARGHRRSPEQGYDPTPICVGCGGAWDTTNIILPTYRCPESPSALVHEKGDTSADCRCMKGDCRTRLIERLDRKQAQRG